MCGILGVVHRSGAHADPHALAAAARSLAHRGPDDSGTWTRANAGFSHLRLSIIDLSSAGHQPMVSADERYVIVYNGEVYNFAEIREALGDFEWSWRSATDTEVVLAAYAKWGPRCVTRFRGMFAFAIWDTREQKLFAARDRLGVKPFYYYDGQGTFAFASRPSAIYRLCPQAHSSLDVQGLRLYLEMGYLPAPFTAHAGLKKLEPAHYLELDARGPVVTQYWDALSVAPQRNWERRSENDLLDELDELVTRSVRARLVSDVPVGAFLSGGVDSSLVVAKMAALARHQVKTFTIGFEESTFDESPHAAEVAQHLGVEHREERVRVSDLLSLMPDFRANFDEPFFDSAAFPTMALSRLARRHVKVSLSGDGGDELFGGYHYYRIVQTLSALAKAPAMLRGPAASLLRALPGHKTKLLGAAMRESSAASIFAFSRSINKDFGQLLTDEAMTDTFGIGELFENAVRRFPDNLQPAEQAMRLDIKHILPEEYLQKVDVASMAYSLEARDPLLDHDLVEWSMKLPLCWKLRGGEKKYLLRKLLYRHVPRAIVDRPKQGFVVPIAQWLRGPLRAWAEERLNDRSLMGRLPLNHAKVLTLFELHLEGRRNAHSLLWAVLMLLEFTSSLGEMKTA